MKAYLGIIIAMGMGKLPNCSDYWKKGVTNMPWFSSIMTRDRFQKLSTYFHLVDNKTAVNKGDPKYSKLFKLGGLENKISKAFFEHYHPGQDLSTDEQMIGMKGRFQIYTGASESGAEQGLASRVVFNLMEPYLDKAYHLYVDNFYTSLKLLQDLEKRKTYACGTVRINRGEFPQSFKEAKLEVSDSTFIRINNILACDQRLSYYSLNRKSYKWWKKIFFRLFEMAIVNSLVLFTHKHPEFTKKRSSHKKYPRNAHS
ncbi:piggyBac transposable element-derived protein 4-like [Clytia hemisphaerica]|uniref:piggyBac transposable element-derived protein 4-like n=1 Tax=Clytia hemisphaerica TaxID=252671 RepID=UPI0034D799EA